MIKHEDVEFIHHAIRVFKEACPYPLVAKAAPYDPKDGGVPPDMMDGDVDSEGWVDWRVLPSTLVEGDVAQVEAHFKIQFPAFFRAYLVSCFHLIDQINNKREFLFLPCLPSDNPLGPISDCINVWKPLLAAGYIPFGDYQDGWGPLCFDTRRPAENGEFPVIWMDHELLVPLGVERAAVRGFVEPLAQPLYPSFRSLFVDQFIQHPRVVGRSHD